jgi:S-adenosylmethionine synthetase
MAVECMGTGDTLTIAGEVGSSAEPEVVRVVESVYGEIGYTNKLRVLNMISRQSEQLSLPIIHGAAGDQGVMYGFACAGSHNNLPFGLHVVNAVAREIDALRDESKLFLPDGKVQATVRGDVIEALVISVQHHATADITSLQNLVLDRAVSRVVNVNDIGSIFFNNKSAFIQGGFANDSGLSGRKIIIDAYGGLAPHGGGSFSGKDPSKVDRCGAYMARFVAKNVVNNGFAEQCLVSVAYVFGEAAPVMLEADLGDGAAGRNLNQFIRDKFDFRPHAIAERVGSEGYRVPSHGNIRAFLRSELSLGATSCPLGRSKSDFRSLQGANRDRGIEVLRGTRQPASQVVAMIKITPNRERLPPCDRPVIRGGATGGGTRPFDQAQTCSDHARRPKGHCHLECH